MCGITGALDLSASQREDDLRAVVDAMRDTLTHRGPDADGTWLDAPAGIALGHRRLSIVDLTSAGAQPMESASGRFVLTYNGELYNAPDLAADLAAAGHRFRGHSDTEVLVEAIAAWGLERTLARANGMYAFAVWDRTDRTLHLVRDRLGEKPLYYGWFGSTLLFGSELKALRAHPAFDAEIDRGALTSYLRFNCVPSPQSIFEQVRKLPPASVLTIATGDARPQTATPRAYWSAVDAFAPEQARTGVTDADATDELEALLLDAVRIRMRSDVPLGAFLSGGVDSATVVALMHAQGDQTVRTFTIGSTSRAHNEADRAALIANRLGSRHTELIVTGDDALATVDRLPVVYDEPFSDSSQIPTLLVSELARRDVTVSLSGDGGDELFGGYNRYFWGRAIWRRIGHLPPAMRRIGARALTTVSPARWDREFRRFGPLLPPRLRQRTPGDRLHKLAEVLAVRNPEDLYLGLVSAWKSPNALVLGGAEYPTAIRDRAQWALLPDFAQQMMFLDLITYLPDDILAKVDRASMGVGLEARVPLLDHRVVEFAATLPLHLKIRKNEGKWLLRQVLYRYVPPALIDRPKMGFGVPIDAWLRGPLRAWAEDLLSADRLHREGFLAPAPIREKWVEHLGGARNWQYYLWNVLQFQAWLAHHNGAAAGVAPDLAAARARG